MTRTPRDADPVITDGLDRIRAELEVPGPFPPDVLAAAEQAARREPGDEHVDRTDLPFVTLDPAGSRDLDQAFAVERRGGDVVLRYAIADVGWFVHDGDPIDAEAWRRGVTLYLPDGRAPLHPPVLSEAVVSLLPDGPRPAVVFTVALDGDGEARLEHVERAVVRSRAQLAYESVRPQDLPDGFDDLAARLARADERRGATRVDPPEQEVDVVDGRFRIAYRPRLPAEQANAALSLATNLAVAAQLLAAGTGLFRVMDRPDERAVARLRHTAAALGLTWPAAADLGSFERGLRDHVPAEAAMMLAIRRAGGGARYEAHRAGAVPWHAAMAATYAHATAPLRRLADRYVVGASLAIARGEAVPAEVEAAFERLPEVMAEADARAGRVERAVLDLVEAAVLRDRVGESFDAVVTDVDERGARVQLCDPAVVARLGGEGLVPGARLRVRVVEADPVERVVRLDRAG